MSKLLETLRRRKDDRGYRADVRCALVEGKRYRAWPHLGYFEGIGDAHQALVVQTIAGLYASHPVETGEGNLGSVCFRLMSDDERKNLQSENGKPGPIGKRLQYILASNGDEIFERVIRLVLYAKPKEISIPYEQLEKDLNDWQYKREKVKAEWAKSFWAYHAGEGE